MLGGYSPLDGTIEFYGRVNAFLKPDFIVADLGAGSGAGYLSGRFDAHRALRDLRKKVSKVIGLDVDSAVLANPSTDENLVIRGNQLPLEDASVDIVVADYVLEHLIDPAATEREVFRILKPGGLFCARTPHALHYASVAARIFRRASGRRVLKRAQPSRSDADVF